MGMRDKGQGTKKKNDLQEGAAAGATINPNN